MTRQERILSRDITTKSVINTRQIQDYLTSGEANNIQIEGVAPSQEAVTFWDLDGAVITDHNGLTNIGINTHAQIDTHIADDNNPHGITPYGIGAANSTHGHYVSHIIDFPTEFAPEAHSHDSDYYNKTAFKDTAAGSIDGGKPIKLNSLGKVDTTMIDISTFSPQGNWDPSAVPGTEYPDATGVDAGGFWIINEIVLPTGYIEEGLPYFTFTGGSLSGTDITTNDVIVKTDTGWAIKSAKDYSGYYALDGSTPITADFMAGGHQLKNVMDGSDNQDAVTVLQLSGKAPSDHEHAISKITNLQDRLDETVKSIVPAATPGEVVSNFIVMTRDEYNSESFTPVMGTVYGLTD